MRSPSVERAVRILDFLIIHPGRGFTLSELSRQLQISKTTARAVLGSLTDRGLVLRNPDTNEYRPGPGLIPMGAVAERSFPAFTHARREAERLAAEYDGECLVVAATAEEVLIVGYAGVPRPLGTTFREGQRQPLAPPLGTIVLAWASDAEVKAWLDRLGPDLTDDERERYRAALERVRGQGYSVALRTQRLYELNELLGSATLDTPQWWRDISRALAALASDGHLPAADDVAPDAEIAAITAPVFGPDGNMLFAIALAPGPEHRAREIEVLAHAVERAAGRVMAAIDGRQPGPVIAPSVS